MNGLVVLFIYAILMIGVTLVFTKRNDQVDSFFVGDRKMGTGISALSIAATWIWAPALFTSTEKAFTQGVIGLFWFLVPNVLCLFLFIPFAKRIRKELPQGITLSGYMQQKYQSAGVKRVYLFQLISLSVLSTGVQLLAGGKMLSIMTGISFPIMVVVLAAIAYSYSQFSGIKASVTTDAVQMVFILLTGIGLIAWLLIGGHGQDIMTGLGGFSGEFRDLFSDNGKMVFFSFGLPTAIGLLSGPFGDQCFWQRAFSIREDKIGRAFGLGAILFGIVPLCMGILGFIAAGSGFSPADTGTVNMEFISYHFPGWVMVPFLFMVISGLLSTVDSNLCAISSLTTDIFKESSLDLSRTAMFTLLVVAIAIANIPGLTVTHLFLFYGTLRASTMLPTILTLSKVRLSASGIIIGVMVSLVIGLPIFAFGNLYNLSVYKTIGSLVTVLSSGILAVIISKIGRRAEA
ncbi:MAG: sodium:solute symporter family protein [Lachnospiraceae bacterium]